MAGRYLLTGAQLGMIAGFAKSKDTQEVLELIQDIHNLQYVGESEQDILDDTMDITNYRLAKDAVGNIPCLPDMEEKHY